MDPVSTLVALWVLALLLQKVPEALAELEFARRGEQSPAARARFERLTAAGIDPAAGGAMRQYVGNAWRDMWLDLDEQRQKRRANRPPYDPDAPTLFDRIRERIDRAVGETTERWRRLSRPDPNHAAGGVTEEPPHRDNPTHADDPLRASGPDRNVDGAEPVADVTDDDGWPPPAGPGWRPGEPGGGWAPPPQPHPATTPDCRGPVVGTLTRIDQPTQPHHPAPPATEGAPAMSSSLVRAGSVTGVISGAAEARAIARALETANSEYVAALNRIRSRIHSLGEQSLSNVQLAARSRVIALTVQAAESAAAAQAAARHCGSEVPPLLGAVAREFDRLNS